MISTAGDAALSVARSPAYLANGAFTLPEPLQVAFSKSSWTAPVSNEAVTIAFKQQIKATDALRTGAYSQDADVHAVHDDAVEQDLAPAGASAPAGALNLKEAGMNMEDLDRPQLGEARREMIREMLMEAGAVTVSQLQGRFGVSPMTARRDLDELERRGTARRTHGGAVLPSIAAPENSFTQRVGVATDAKIRLADAAFALLAGGETVFLDSSSTAYFLARRIAEGRAPAARADQQRPGDAGARRLRRPACGALRDRRDAAPADRLLRRPGRRCA